MILRGGTKHFLVETERLLHEAIIRVCRAIKNDFVVASGSIEKELSKMLPDHSRTTKSKEKLLYDAIAKALEKISFMLHDCAETSIIQFNAMQKAAEATCLILSENEITKTNFNYNLTNRNNNGEFDWDKVDFSLKTDSNKKATLSQSNSEKLIMNSPNNSKNGSLKIKRFILDSLKKRNGDAFVWVDESKRIFRFVDPIRAPKQWGSTKPRSENEMNYDKMTRAMRYMYDTKELRKVNGLYTFQFLGV